MEPENEKEGLQHSPHDGVADEVLLLSSLEDPRLFEILVARYQEPFLRAAQRVVFRREDAEDIVQEAFLKIYRYAGRFEKRADIEFKSWAYKIVLNTAFTHYQRLKRRGAKEAGDGDEMLINVPEGGKGLEEEIELKHVVERALKDLSPDLARILSKHYLEDKAYEAIAAEEGSTIAAVKMKLYRARAAFKKLSVAKGSY